VASLQPLHARPWITPPQFSRSSRLRSTRTSMLGLIIEILRKMDP
jgi:hypothetical protein